MQIEPLILITKNFFALCDRMDGRILSSFNRTHFFRLTFLYEHKFFFLNAGTIFLLLFIAIVPWG